MMKLLEGKTALITGASRGIGKTIALRFALEGASIAITNIVEDEEFLNTIEEIRAHNVTVIGYVSNAADFADSQRVIEQIVKDFGRIDILVNNAGITRDNPMRNQTSGHVLNINLKSVSISRQFTEAMMSKRRVHVA